MPRLEHACLLALALVAAVGEEPAPQSWSGTIVVEKLTRLPPATDEDVRDLDQYLAETDARLAAVRKEMAALTLEQRQSPLGRLLQQDAATCASELERARLARGGELVEERWSYLLREVPWQPFAGSIPAGGWQRLGRGHGAVLVQGTGRPVLALAASNEVRMRRADGGIEPIALAGLPPPLDGLVEEPGGLRAFAHPLARCRIEAEGTMAEVTVALGLPNPFAFVLVAPAKDEALETQLARLPGLPIEVRSPIKNGERVLRVSELRPHAVGEDALRLPEAEQDPGP